MSRQGCQRTLAFDLDFRDFDAYQTDVLEYKDYLFHIGAHTDLEYCEQNPNDAYLTNTLPSRIDLPEDIDAWKGGGGSWITTFPEGSSTESKFIAGFTPTTIP